MLDPPYCIPDKRWCILCSDENIHTGDRESKCAPKTARRSATVHPTQGGVMESTRRRFVLGSVASLSALALGRPSVSDAQAPTTIKISHQFPGGTATEGDFRDRLVRRFAAEVEKKTSGGLKF